MSISTRSSLRTSTTTSINQQQQQQQSFNRSLRRRPLKPTQTSNKPAIARVKTKTFTRKKLKNSTNLQVTLPPVVIKRTVAATRMLSSGNQPPQFNQVKNKFANYRRKSSAAIRIPSQSHHHHQQQQSHMPQHSSSSMHSPSPFHMSSQQQMPSFNRQSSYNAPSQSQPMSLPNNNANFGSAFQFNPTALAAAAVTLVQMMQNVAQNKQDSQQTQSQSQRVQQHQQHQHSSLSNRRHVNMRYASSSSFSTNESNIVSNYQSHGSSFNNKSYSNPSPFMQQQQQMSQMPQMPQQQLAGPFSSHQLQNKNQQNQQQSMPYNHRYSTRFKHARASLPPSKDKKTAPYNTTQYIMHDYFKRRAIDQECPNEQQQFSDEWNMALATNAGSGSSNSSVINLDMLKEAATRSATLEERADTMNLSTAAESEQNVGDLMMSVDDDVLLSKTGDERDELSKLSSSI